MNESDKNLENASKEELEKLKIWLFRENVRMEAQRKEIDDKYIQFDLEKKQFQKEMKQLNQKILSERKRLSKDQLLFEKKLVILQNAYKQLEIDKKMVEQEKKSSRIYKKSSVNKEYPNEDIKFCFEGVNNIMTLKKRYKDLLKIFHPDNLCGDTDIVQMINKEYDKLRDSYKYE